MSSSHQSKFPCIIITIIIILLFFSSFSTLLTVNLFVLFWRCFVMLNSYFVCFIIYIFFFNFENFFVDIIFVPKIGVCFSFYPVSLIFEYEAKPHIRWPHIREYEAGESGANFTSVSPLSILPISSAINAPIIPMPMKQPWRIWVFKPQKSSRTHKSNQTNTTKSCAYFTGNTASQGYNSDGTNYCSLGILRKELTA